jgi:hypothetical protein
MRTHPRPRQFTHGAVAALVSLLAACGDRHRAVGSRLRAGTDRRRPAALQLERLHRPWDHRGLRGGVRRPVVEDFYPSNEEMLARVVAGGAQYDVVVPSDYMIEIMIEDGLLLPLTRDAIPNLANVDEDFIDPPYDPGLQFSVPYLWGTTGPRRERRAAGRRRAVLGARVRSGGRWEPARPHPAARRPPRDDGRSAALPRLQPEHDRRGRAACRCGRDRDRPRMDRCLQLRPVRGAARLRRGRRVPRLLGQLPRCVRRTTSASPTSSQGGRDAVDRQPRDPRRRTAPVHGAHVPRLHPAPGAGRTADQLHLLPSPNALATRPFIDPDILEDPAVYPDRTRARPARVPARTPASRRSSTRTCSRRRPAESTCVGCGTTPTEGRGLRPRRPAEAHSPAAVARSRARVPHARTASAFLRSSEARYLRLPDVGPDVDVDLALRFGPRRADHHAALVERERDEVVLTRATTHASRPVRKSTTSRTGAPAITPRGVAPSVPSLRDAPLPRRTLVDERRLVADPEPVLRTCSSRSASSTCAPVPSVRERDRRTRRPRRCHPCRRRPRRPPPERLLEAVDEVDAPPLEVPRGRSRST